MPNKLSQFWQELNRRNVVRVMTVYAGAAFVILELVDIIAEPLKLPSWLLPVVIVLLSIGFIIAVILSWIYDVHTEGGIVKTEPSKDVETDGKTETPNSWRIATFVSLVIIIGLLVFNLFGGRIRVKIDESLAKSIAVLPFQNFSEDSDQDFMCLGLTDEIINHLYKLESFDKVVSLTSVLNYRDPNRNVPFIGEELGVNYILEGTYKKIGEDLKVSAQLIQVNSDKHIWQQDYNRPYAQIMSIQSDIAIQIADHIKAFITDKEKDRIQNIPTTNQEAYEALQRAVVEFNSLKFSNFDQLISFAQEAIKLDPEYANAYAWAGTFTLYSGVYSGYREITSVAWEAKRYLNKALELDTTCSIAHLGLGNIYEWVEWDYVKAEEEYVKINLLEPHKPVNYGLLAEFFMKMNRLDDFQAIPFNPAATNLSMIPSKVQILKGDRTDAKKMINNVADEYRNSNVKVPYPYHEIGLAYIWLEEYRTAYHYLDSVLQVGNPQMSIPRFYAGLALTYYKTSMIEQAELAIDKLIQRSQISSAGSPAFYIGWYYSWIGEVDSAFYWLGNAYENNSPEFPHFKVDPAFNSLKDDDRYWDLYERTGHKAYDDYMTSKEK